MLWFGFFFREGCIKLRAFERPAAYRAFIRFANLRMQAGLHECKRALLSFEQLEMVALGRAIRRAQAGVNSELLSIRC